MKTSLTFILSSILLHIASQLPESIDVTTSFKKRNIHLKRFWFQAQRGGTGIDQSLCLSVLFSTKDLRAAASIEGLRQGGRRSQQVKGPTAGHDHKQHISWLFLTGPLCQISAQTHTHTHTLVSSTLCCMSCLTLFKVKVLQCSLVFFHTSAHTYKEWRGLYMDFDCGYVITPKCDPYSNLFELYRA